MKQKFSMLLVAIITLLAISSMAWAAPVVMLDRQELTFDVPPAVENGRTLVPLRAIFEKLGAKVDWNEAAQTVAATKGNTVIKLTVNSAVAYKNGQAVTLDVPAKLRNGRTLVPLRFVSETMGCYVGWDSSTETVRILQNQPQFVTVSRVIDGDTIGLETGEKIRLIGIDAPESGVENEPYGKEAAVFVKNLLEGKKVWLESDIGTSDEYGRSLAYVFTESGSFVNAKLVADGYAKVMTIAPNIKYEDVLIRMEQQAKNADKGLWAAQKNPVVTIEVTDGKIIKMELYPEIAPNTVNNFISLVKAGFYDNTVFHRVIPGFVIQGGDPLGNGTGGPGYSIEGEFTANGFENNLNHKRGILSMARASDPDSAGSQFFIMVADYLALDGQYAAFGKVIEGLDGVDKIVNVPRDVQDMPLQEQKMKRVWVETFGVEYPEPEKTRR